MFLNAERLHGWIVRERLRVMYSPPGSEYPVKSPVYPNTEFTARMSTRKGPVGLKKNSSSSTSKSSKKMTSHTAAPVSKGTRSRSGAPSFSALRRNGSVTVTHSELFQTFPGSSSGGFQIFQASINPGLAYLFPWLHNVAINYEKYRFRKLKFRFVSAVPTSVHGFVGLAVDPDANDTVPESMPALMSYNGACSGNTWMSCDLQVPVSHLGELYLRSGIVLDTDVKTYDIGNFLYGTTTLSSESDTLGYLYVDYEVDLINPAAHIVSGAVSESLSFTSTANSNTLPFSGAQTYGTLPVIVAENAIGFDRVGVYEMVMRCGRSAVSNPDVYIDAANSTVGWAVPTSTQGGITFTNNGSTTTGSSVIQILIEVTESFQTLYFDLASALAVTAPVLNAAISVLPNFIGLFASTGAAWHPPRSPSPVRLISCSTAISESEARKRLLSYKQRNSVTQSARSDGVVASKLLVGVSRFDSVHDQDASSNTTTLLSRLRQQNAVLLAQIEEMEEKRIEEKN